jgi:hypothetical protein
LFLGVPVDGSTVDEVEDTSHRSPRQDIVIQVGINIMGEYDFFPKRRRRIVWEVFLYITIDRCIPVVFGMWKVRVIRFMSAESDSGVLHLVKVGTYSFGSVKMSTARQRSKT